MKKILILGAGRSSSSLISYLLQNSQNFHFKILVGDADLTLAQKKIKTHPNGIAYFFNLNDETSTNDLVAKADLVISMVPAQMHIQVLKACLRYSVSMFSASYVTSEIKALEREIRDKGILVLKECGLDPGLDHMSAMQAIDQIHEKGGKLISFRSYTGGLISPQSDNNPWHYKFTWNPRNVVLAGQGTAKYIMEHQYKYIPYHQLFSRTEKINTENYGEFEGYANRDSLSYRKIYRLESIPTILRGTIRKAGFCKAWNLFVQLGLTDDSYRMENSDSLTFRSFIAAFLPPLKNLSVEDAFCKYLQISRNSEEFNKVEWLGLFEETPVTINDASPAQVLQSLLEEKWALQKDDQDMIVMQHQFEYQINGLNKKLISELVVEGEDTIHTAMAKTVGLPLGIAAKLLFQNKIGLTGLHIPVKKELYEPILKELEFMGFSFSHREDE
ncbi:saccharopine dehydrogenase C-terminal domain-containing protein [soil metagenome]